MKTERSGCNQNHLYHSFHFICHSFHAFQNNRKSADKLSDGKGGKAARQSDVSGMRFQGGMGYADNKRQLWKAISTEEELARAWVFTSVYNVDRELMGMASQTPPSQPA